MGSLAPSIEVNLFVTFYLGKYEHSKSSAAACTSELVYRKLTLSGKEAPFEHTKQKRDKQNNQTLCTK